jgi:hypothetical protein
VFASQKATCPTVIVKPIPETTALRFTAVLAGTVAATAPAEVIERVVVVGVVAALAAVAAHRAMQLSHCNTAEVRPVIRSPRFE